MIKHFAKWLESGNVRNNLLLEKMNFYTFGAGLKFGRYVDVSTVGEGLTQFKSSHQLFELDQTISYLRR